MNGRGLRLTCLRLAGERDAFDAEVRKLAAEVPLSAGTAVFLLNGRAEDALTALTKNNDHAQAAELLAARLRFREALDMADRAKPGDVGGDALTTRLFKAGLLARLGERPKAREVLDKMATEAQGQQNVGALEAVMAAEYGAGFKDKAFARGADLLAKLGEGSDCAGVLNVLFPLSEMDTGVEPWWRFLRRKYPNDGAAATLKRMRDLFGRKLSNRETTALLKEMTDEVANLKPQEREPWLHCAADTCRALGRDDLTESYLEKWAAAGGDALPWLYLGDLSAERKRWKEAAERYRRGWEKERSNPAPLYLYGRALAQAGQEKEGRRWMEAAELLPLGSEEKRSALAQELAERGLDEAAGREWERLGRLVLLTSGYDSAVAQALSEKSVAARDYLTASKCYRRMGLFYVLYNTSADVEGSLWVLAAERRTRARALAAAGRLDDMRKEVNAALAVEPNIDLAIDLVANLTKRGQKKEADELFARVYAAHDAVCKEYPKSAWAHNNTAWLAARCKRDLDAALEHGRKGVELEPDNAAHLDTLAEVHFQRGDKDKAVELMTQCVALQPKSAYFRNQLKRMRAGDRDAELPRESSYRAAATSP